AIYARILAAADTAPDLGRRTPRQRRSGRRAGRFTPGRCSRATITGPIAARHHGRGSVGPNARPPPEPSWGERDRGSADPQRQVRRDAHAAKHGLRRAGPLLSQPGAHAPPAPSWAPPPRTP